MDKSTLPLGILNRLLDPVGRCLSAQAARELAEKCNEGTLSAEERAEYEACVMAANIVAILQAKARTRLETPS